MPSCFQLHKHFLKRRQGGSGGAAKWRSNLIATPAGNCDFVRANSILAPSQLTGRRGGVRLQLQVGLRLWFFFTRSDGIQSFPPQSYNVLLFRPLTRGALSLKTSQIRIFECGMF